MKTGVILSRNAGGTWAVVCDPSTPVGEQRRKYKEIIGSTKDGQDDVIYIERLESGVGRVARKSFRSKAEQERVDVVRKAEAAKAEAKPEAPAPEPVAKPKKVKKSST